MYKLDIEKYPRIKKRLQAVVGAQTDLNQFAVFELMANDTTAITKAAGRLKNARMTQGYLQQMAGQIQENLYVPLIELHQQNEKLPVGRVIDAAVFDNKTQPDEKDLHLIIYLEAEHAHTNKISTGIINEVSTGTTPRAVTCSACGYNFMANEESKERLWKGENYMPLCPDGHQWGRNGVHLKLSEMAEWREISVVTRGAAPNARVLKESEVRLALENDQINLSVPTDNDTLLLSTVEGADLKGFVPPKDQNPKPTPDKGEKNHMTDINLTQEKYDALIAAKALSDANQANFTAEKAAKEKAEADLAQAQADLKAEKEAKEKAEADLAAEKAAKEKAEADLTAAQAQIAVLQGGSNPGGNGNPAGSPTDTNAPANLAAGVLPESYFKVEK